MIGATDRYEVAVVGAGQAGLAVGHFLREHGRRFVILEAAGSVGSAWRTCWDSLVLFTPRRYDALPGLAFPGDPDGYPTRDEVRPTARSSTPAPCIQRSSATPLTAARSAA